MSWPLVQLGDVAPAKASKHTFAETDDVWTLNLDQIEADTGKVLQKIIAPASEAGSSTHGFDERHVLYSKLRPYLNKVVLPNDKGLATTELVPMLPDADRLERKYLAYYLRSKGFVDWVSAQVAGAKMPRVSMQLFWQHEIPLPPLPEQKRIAAILDKADVIRRKRQQAIQLADDFLRAVFLDMFGDPVTNPKGWELKTLGELCTKITDGEHGTVKRLESGRLYLMARNIDRKGNLDLSDVSYISEADHQRIYKRCGPEKGDVLLVCVGATIGKALVVPDIGEFSLARSVALLKPGKEIVSEYLLSLINTDALQRQFVSSGNSSAQAGLYLGKIKEIMVPVPGLKEQLRFKEIVNFVKEKFSSKINGGNLESDFVLSLSQKAFSGQL